VLDAKPEIKAAGIDYLGIAHGWAGFLYTTLQWCSVSKTTLPEGVQRRLVELAALALPINRGLDWPWVLGRSGEPPHNVWLVQRRMRLCLSLDVWLTAC
jgi:hypothetical protein